MLALQSCEGMLRNPSAGLFPVAVFDDDRRTHGYSLMGVPVVGSIDDIPAAVAKLQIQQVLLAIPDPSTALVERCVRLTEEAKSVLKIVPDLQQLVGSVSAPSVSVRAAREPRIEDLLGRHEVVTDLAAVRSALEGRQGPGDRCRGIHRLGDLPPGIRIQPGCPDHARP